MMTKGDLEGQIFLFHPHTNNRFFSGSSLYYIPEYAEMQKNILESGN